MPKPKVKLVGADYHQGEMDKLEDQVVSWEENLHKAKLNVARLERGIKERQKELKRHTKERDKKAAS